MKCSVQYWAAGLALAVLCLVTPRAAPALDIRVQGQAELNVQARTAGTRLVATGHLLDDLDTPLPQRQIQLRLQRARPARVLKEWTATTGRRGRFEAGVDVPPGKYKLTARFEPTSHLEGASSDTEVTVVQRPVELRLSAPAVVRPAKETPIEVGISASVKGRGLKLPAEVAVNGEAVEEVELDDGGQGRIDLAEHLQAGDNRVTVRVEGGEFRSSAARQAGIRVTEALEADAAFEQVLARLQRGATVSGTVRDAVGPVQGMRVSATVRRIDAPEGAASEDGQPTEAGGDPSGEAGGEATGRAASRVSEHAAAAVTDAAGGFEIFFDEEKLEEGTWRARLQVVPEIGEPLEVSAGELTIDHTLSTIVMNAAGLIALLALLVVVGRESWEPIKRRIREWRERRERQREREHAFQEEEELGTSVLPGAAEGEGWPSKRGVGGMVWDVWRGRPVAGARITVSREDGSERRELNADEGGHFHAEELPEGQWELQIAGEGFVRATRSFGVPHDGRLSRSRYELVAVPLKIRRLYQALVEEAKGRDLWGRLSPREIQTAVMEMLDRREGEPGSEAAGRFVERVRESLREGGEDLETPRDYLEALTGVVEETYFSGRDYDEEVWRLARRIALRLREMLLNEEAAA